MPGRLVPGRLVPGRLVPGRLFLGRPTLALALGGLALGVETPLARGRGGPGGTTTLGGGQPSCQAVGQTREGQVTVACLGALVLGDGDYSGPEARQEAFALGLAKHSRGEHVKACLHA